MKRAFIIAAAVSLVAVSLAAGILLAGLAGGQEPKNKLYVCPVSAGEKTYTITVDTDWGEAPKVSLSEAPSDIRHAVIVYFLGTEKKTVTYNVTIPTELLGGNISLVRKYYVQSPDLYILTSNSTHNSLQTTFDYAPFLSGNGWFEIVGTEGAW